jgi:hypothetical protein
LSRVSRAIAAVRSELPSSRRARWEAERLLALEAELELLREANARLTAERGRPPDAGTLVERLRAASAGGDDARTPQAAGAAHGDAAWDALTRVAALREALLVICVELEQTAIHARALLERAGRVLDDDPPGDPDGRP